MTSYHCERAMRGWLAGCGAVTALVCAIYLIALTATPEGVFSVRFLAGVTALFIPALLFFVITCLLTGIPAAAIVWLSEKFQIRAIWFFGCAGAAIGALSVELLLRGIGGGASSSDRPAVRGRRTGCRTRLLVCCRQIRRWRPSRAQGSHLSLIHI